MPDFQPGRLGPAIALGLASVLFAACNGNTKEEGGSSTGNTSETTAEPVTLFSTLGDEVLGVANLDDDDENAQHDWEDLSPDDGEHVPLGWDAEAFGMLGEGEIVRLTLDGDIDEVRVWVGGEVALDDSTLTVDLSSSVDPTTIAVEFKLPMSTAELTLEHIGADGATLDTHSIGLLSAPLILNHHLQEAQWAVAVDTGTGRYGNEAFIDGFQDILGGDFGTVNGRTVGYDVWIQDELEYGTLTAPGYEMQFVIDSIRSGGDRYLDIVPEEVMWGPDTGVWTWGTGRPTSQDSFGNLEVSPPVTVDGVEYPFGRAYYGDSGRYAMTAGMQEFLAEQKVQAPFTLDIGWLCVGHVDEFSTFLPDPSAPKGFRLYVADIDLGRTFLESLDPSTYLPRYEYGHGFSNIGEMVDDGPLWSYNRDLMDENIEPNIDRFKAALGLDEGDIVRVPAVFERSSECGGVALSLITGTVNMQVNTWDDHSTADLFIPDPFLRGSSASVSSDPFVIEFEAMLPSNVTPHWLDDFDSYHLMWGEVHCGSNTRRTPVGGWWDNARHLLED